MLIYDGRNFIMMFLFLVVVVLFILFCAQDLVFIIGEFLIRLYRNKKIMDKLNFRNSQLIMYFLEKDNKFWVFDDGIYYCFIKYFKYKKIKSYKNQYFILIFRYFVVEFICSCFRNYMFICINCYYFNCVMV